MENAKTCTDGSNQWAFPRPAISIPYLPISKIQFKPLKSNQIIPLDEKPADKVPSLTQSQIDNFFQELSKSKTKPAILSIVPGYSDKYVPLVTQSKIIYLGNLFKPGNMGLSEALLAEKCRSFKMDPLSTDTIRKLQLETQSQASCNLWYDVRTGRVTASRLREVCHTSLTNPSKSLLKHICYPIQSKFTTEATAWGIKNEVKARSKYFSIMINDHESFKIEKSGFCINNKWLWMGASPDGFVYCQCCGNGLLEIKCPFVLKDKTITEQLLNSNFCLEEVNGQLMLKRDHAYYYQVQCQLAVSEASYCDFFLWSKKEHYMERIYFDEIFWNQKVAKAENFFINCILPELFCKWFTRSVL